MCCRCNVASMFLTENGFPRDAACTSRDNAWQSSLGRRSVRETSDEMAEKLRGSRCIHVAERLLNIGLSLSRTSLDVSLCETNMHRKGPMTELLTTCPSG